MRYTFRPQFLLLILLSWPALGLAQGGPQVDISSLVNSDLTTYTNGSDYPPNGGPLTINGVPFNLATIGSNSDTAVIQTTGQQSYSIPVNLAGITTVYTLINSADGACGTSVGEVDFVGATSGTYVYTLVEGTNVRDHNNSSFCNTATGIAGSAGFGGGQVRLDMQQINLPASFISDTLVSVTFTSYGAGGGGQPFLAAMSGFTLDQEVSLPVPLQFIPVTPCRVVDTRGPAGPFGGPELGAGTAVEFDLPQGVCNIPANAMAYSLNATVVPNGSLNYLTLWPSGTAQPNASTLNSLDGRVKANAAFTQAGINGGVDVFVSDASQVILDIDGYFMPAGTPSALSFYPVTPCRAVDTRGAADPLGGPFISGGSSRDFPILSSDCSLPANAQAYSFNVTAIPHNTLNYLTAWPSDQTQPVVSTLNAPTGAITANAAVVPAASDGDISVYVSDDADVVLDVNGYFAAPDTNGLSLYTGPPCRILDTRTNGGPIDGAVAITGIEDTGCAPPSTPQAFVMNATVVPVGTLGYLTLWPDGEDQPFVSTLNAYDGSITSNLAIVPTTNGVIDAFATDPTQLILDLSGYFAP